MRNNNHRLVAVIVGAALAQGGLAHAQPVSPDDAKCRAGFQKTLSKYNATIHKTIASCWKSVLKDKLDADTDCNSLDTADQKKGKALKAKNKLIAAIGGDKTKCDESAHADALLQFSASGCPSPAAGPIATWADARDCAIAITEFQAEQVWRYSFDPPEADVSTMVGDKALNKCAAGLHKGWIKLSATAAKERGKAQADSDKSAGSYDFLQGNADPKQKIAGAAAKLEAAMDKSCASQSTGELAALNSCRADVPGLKECLVGPWERNGSGVLSMAYEQAGICPTAMLTRVDPGKGGGRRLNETRIDSGWSGHGHDVDLSEGIEQHVDLSCDDSTCGACTPSLVCDDAGTNCRCSNDLSITCTTPNGADDACGGSLCEYFLGAPLPLSASNTPVCAVNKILGQLDALVPLDIGAGTQTTTWNTASVVYTGDSQGRPCPTCSGAAIGDAGTCANGPRNGMDCTTTASHPAFGNTSLDCPPEPGSNVSGPGLQLNLVLSDAPPDLPEGTDCTLFGLDANCACAVCTDNDESGDNNIPCNGDADCPAGETCSTHGDGTASQPNGCSDLTCTDGLCAAEEGEDIVMYCDNFLRGDGQGILVCDDNDDCEAADDECPSGNCGNCTLSKTRECFTSGLTDEVISAAGVPGTDGAVVASTFCLPPTSSTAINIATGVPGPSRLINAVRTTASCPNGEPWQFPGGSNCQ